jgi:hypothetical protein
MKPVFTLDDGTQVLETTGDSDALDYGGGVLYRAPGNLVFWDFWDAPEKNYFVYRADVSAGVLDRYEVDLQEICLASAGELTEKDIVKLSEDEDPRARLQLVSLIRDAYGATHIDPSGPMEATKFDIAEQWGFLFGVEKDNVEEISPEDYIVKESDIRWESGRVDGKFLGRYSRYEEAISAVADDMDKIGLFTNLFHEHSPGKIELVQWDPSDYIGGAPVVRGKMPTVQWKIAMRKYNSGPRRSSRRKKSISKIRRSESMKVAQRGRIERAKRIRSYL